MGFISWPCPLLSCPAKLRLVLEGITSTHWQWCCPFPLVKNVDDLETYMQSSIYLPDINNEGPVKNQTYVSKIKQLDKLVLVRFSDDQTGVLPCVRVLSSPELIAGVPCSGSP